MLCDGPAQPARRELDRFDRSADAEAGRDAGDGRGQRDPPQRLRPGDPEVSGDVQRLRDAKVTVRALEFEGGHESNDEMEVESEEDDEEEFKVRLAGGAGPRKKRAVQFDDEDE